MSVGSDRAFSDSVLFASLSLASVQSNPNIGLSESAVEENRRKRIAVKASLKKAENNTAKVCS